jgi:hypothetical protein
VANVLEQLLIDVKTIGTAVAGGEIARLGGQVKKADEAAGKASTTHARLGKTFSGVKGIAATTAGVIGAQGMTAAFGEGIKSAIQMQRAQAQLGNSIKQNVHKPAEDATEQLSNFADVQSVKGGFEPWQNVGAMAQFARATHSTTEAQKDLSLATDLARGSHRSFAQSVQAVTMVENGRATSLRRMGISIQPVTTAEDKLRDSHVKTTSAMRNRAKEEDKQATRLKALAQLQKSFGGASESYSKTAEGAMSNFKNSLDVLTTRLGAVFLPIITKVFGAMAKFVGQMIEGKGAGGTFVDVLQHIWGVLKIVWSILWPIVKFLFDIVKSIVVLGIQVVKVGITVYNWAKKATAEVTKWVVNAWNNATRWVVNAWNNIKKGAQVVWNWIKTAATNTKNWVVDRFNDMKRGAQIIWGWMKSAATDVKNWIQNRFTEVKNWVVNRFNDIKSGVQGVWSWIKTQASNVKTWIEQRFTDVVNWFKSWPGKIKAGLSGLASAIEQPFKDAFNWVKDHSPSVSISHIGPVPIPHFHFPGLQAGGWVNQRGTYLVGERGPELVTLPHGAYVTPNERIHERRGDRRGTPEPSERPIILYNILDGKVLSKSVVRQGLLQSSRS